MVNELKNKDGFTIIELLIATSLFILVIGLASGTFVNSLRTQRSVMALMAANDNASLAIERIAREIRFGSGFSGSSGGSQISFTNQKKEGVVYKLEDDAITRNGVAITSGNVKVEYLFFDLAGAEVGDGQSTRVTIRLGVSSFDASSDIVTQIQTTISSRQLDT